MRPVISGLVDGLTCVSLCAIGVAQMANKEKMLPFTSTDQESLEVCNYYTY